MILYTLGLLLSLSPPNSLYMFTLLFCNKTLWIICFHHHPYIFQNTVHDIMDWIFQNSNVKWECAIIASLIQMILSSSTLVPEVWSLITCPCQPWINTIWSHLFPHKGIWLLSSPLYMTDSSSSNCDALLSFLLSIHILAVQRLKEWSTF